jgi:hypothetical protein
MLLNGNISVHVDAMSVRHTGHVLPPRCAPHHPIKQSSWKVCGRGWHLVVIVGLRDRRSRQIGQVSFMYSSALTDFLLDDFDFDLLLLLLDDFDLLLLADFKLAGLEKILDSLARRVISSPLDDELSPPRRILRVILFFERNGLTIYIYINNIL